MYTEVVLSRQRVIEAALLLAAADGIEAVGVRSVGARLAVTPMAVYRYVSDADALARATLTAIVEQLPVLDDSVDWRESYRAWAASAREILARYPGAAHKLLTCWFELGPMLRQVEGLVRTALRGGLRGFEAVAAANGVLTYVLMRVEAEATVRRAAVVERALRDVRRRPASFPLLHEHLAHYETARFDEHFAYGLDVLLRGIEVRNHADTRRKRSRSARDRRDRERAPHDDHD